MHDIVESMTTIQQNEEFPFELRYKATIIAEDAAYAAQRFEKEASEN